MARQTYGKTPWGAEWIAAMERIDHNTNRLPRGRTYANRGSVLSVEIRDGGVLAKVQGSRSTPYRIEIRLAPLSEKAVSGLLQVIESMPSVAIQLSLGRMPGELLEALKKKGINPYPKSWNDIQANCSCPDWANPCKHLAAVYYILANEIDKNPFLLFELGGVKKSLLVREIAGNSELAALPMESFIPFADAPPREIPNEIDVPALNFPSGDGARLFTLLPQESLFYAQGDFRKVLSSIQETAGRAADNVEVSDEKIENLSETAFHLVYSGKDPVLFAYPAPSFLDGEVASHAVPPETSGGRWKRVEGRQWPLEEGLRFFLSRPLETTLDMQSPTARFLNVAVSMALALIRAGSTAPAFEPLEGGAFAIRHTALARSDRTRDAIALLATLFPSDMAFQGRSVLHQNSLSVLFDRILTSVMHILLAPHASSLPGDKVTSTFIRGEVFRPRQFEEMQTGMALGNWLARLTLHGGNMVPVLHFEIVEESEEFAMGILVENRKEALAVPAPLAEIFREGTSLFGKPAERAEVLRALTIAADYLPQIKEVVNSRGKLATKLTLEQMGKFLQGNMETLSLLGIRVMLPRELARLARPAVRLRASAKGQAGEVSYLSLAQMLQFSPHLALGDMEISVGEFRKLMKSATGLVRYRDQFIMLDAGEAESILRRLKDMPDQLSGLEKLRATLAGERDGIAIDPDETVRRILEELGRPKEIALPEGIHAELRPYQMRGYQWLHANASLGMGCCLADDMGLGKTLQVLTFLQKRKEEGTLKNPALVVCPTTLVGNWRKECEKFTPGLEASIYHGAQRRLLTQDQDFIITTYGLMRRDIEKFRSREWSVVILDEAQAIKNPDAEQTRAVKSLKAGACIAMTGTPVENRLSELWSIFDFVGRGYLGHLAGFRRDFATPIEKYRDPEKAETLRKVTAPFLLRRMKTDRSIIQDLPEKVITDDYCNLTAEQAALYETVVQDALGVIRESEAMERRGLIFQMITRLKQICNHPVHFSKNGTPGKAASGKAERTMELLQSIQDAHEKVLIFTQYREMGDLLVELIREEFRHAPLFFHGGVARAKRDKMVADFQENPAHRIMIVSLKAGGAGLNLTAANHVIHYDLWWNPAVENQATDRVFRIGQQKNVMVNRLITLGTFEEKIDEMIKSKQELTNLAVSAGENWITEMSDEELREIFMLPDRGR